VEEASRFMASLGGWNRPSRNAYGERHDGIGLEAGMGDDRLGYLVKEVDHMDLRCF